MKEDIHKFKEGDFVYAKTNLDQKLKVRRYNNRIYYCTLVDLPNRKELVLFERELVENPTNTEE